MEWAEVVADRADAVNRRGQTGDFWHSEWHHRWFRSIHWRLRQYCGTVFSGDAAGLGAKRSRKIVGLLPPRKEAAV